MRLRRQLSHSTEASYLHYIVEFIRFHGKHHVRELGVGEIRAYLSQATEKDGAASTQSMALSALLFLYRLVLGYAMAAGGEFPDDYHWFCAKCYGGLRYMRSSQNSPSTTTSLD
jgi:Phage integrase, N-terminal SAM-like domain